MNTSELMTESNNRRQITDQMGRKMFVVDQPERIISLVPSQTELLTYLGLAANVVGRTRFCIHPAETVEQIQIVGGTKKFRFDIIDALAPDLIIGNKEENYEEGITQLSQRYPVWMSDILTVADALDMIRRVGDLTARSQAAEALAIEIETRFAQLPRLGRPLRVAYFIWQKPFMVAGQGTFIDDLLQRCGFVNVFADRSQGRYPEITEAQLTSADPDLILLSSEPFPFAAKHRPTFETLCPRAAVHLVDGEMFSWYGNRLLLAADYLERFLATVERSF